MAHPVTESSEGVNMGNNTSPLESLAAFAIAFAAGVLTTGALGAYIKRLKTTASAALKEHQA